MEQKWREVKNSVVVVRENELMKRLQMAQAHSNTYHPQTNGLVEKQNRTILTMIRVYCSRYIDDWDKHLPQVVADFKREYKNIEFLRKQRPGAGGMIALPSVASLKTGKYLFIL